MRVLQPALVLLSSGPVYGYLAYACGFHYQLAIPQSLGLSKPVKNYWTGF